MLRKSIFYLALALAVLMPLSPADVRAEKAAPNGNNKDASGLTFLLFGAPWCAPCVAEIRNIAELAEAAAPSKVIIVWGDSKLKQYHLPKIAGLELAMGNKKIAYQKRFEKETRGIPYTAVLDSAGKKCAEAKLGLTTARIAELKAKCLTGL